MILLGGIVWFLSNLILSKVINSQRTYEAISIILALSVGVFIIKILRFNLLGFGPLKSNDLYLLLQFPIRR